MVTIKNARALTTSPAAKACVTILNAALAAVNPGNAVLEAVKRDKNLLSVAGKRYALDSYDRVFVVGLGKASGAMAAALMKVISDRVTKGLVIDIKARKLGKVSVVAGDHPQVSSKNIAYTRKILEMTSNLSVRDLVICLISGGGSALFSDPRITLDSYQRLIKKVFLGATIQELNCVRKHLDSVKGGQFAAHLFPATVISLIISDVPGNDLASIASGPTVLDPTTVKDAERILRRSNLKTKFTETPKEESWFRKVQNVIVLDNSHAVRAMERAAESLKLTPRTLSLRMTGEARDTGLVLLDRLENKTAVIAAGETTVTVIGHGKGGRNQELVLGAVKDLAALKHVALASMGTDGHDNSDFAGALADGTTLSLALRKKLDVDTFLKNNDSYTFWKKIGKGIKTGKTGTNVSDVMVAVRF